MTKAAQKPAKPAGKPKPPRAVSSAPEALYSMPMEVRSWIERAQSIMNHQRGEIERLKAENTDLKSYKRWAEQRILRADQE